MKKQLLLLLVIVAVVASCVALIPEARTQTQKTPAILVYRADGTAAQDAHIVIGKAQLPSYPVVGNATVTFVGGAAFTSTDTYVCTIQTLFSTSVGGPMVGPIRKIDGSHVQFRGSDTQEYMCIGN